MRSRLWVAAGILLALIGIAVSAGSAYAYFWDRDRADLIAKGVHVAGIDIGGLRAPEARALLERRLADRLRRPVRLVYRQHRFTIHPTHAGLRVGVAEMVGAALRTSRRGGLAHRLWRDLRGKDEPAAIPLRAAVSAQRLSALARRVARILDRPARSAHVVPLPLALGLRVVPSHTGLAVRRSLLVRRLTTVLLRPDARRATIAVPTRPVHPRWPTKALPRRYSTFLLVSRETFTLRLFKHLKLLRTYPIAVGQAGLETPAGLYDINDKQIDPSWHVPRSAWAGALAGQVIPPGPEDPLKARWLGFYNGAGIHGTADTWSLGSAASHGCIRMSIPDVEQLYDLVPLHTPIYVG
jgi:hypothetical protein